MQMTWRGYSCIELVSPTSRGEARVLINPFQPSLSNRPVKEVETDVLLMTHQGNDANYQAAALGNPFVIQDPGEYEVREVFFFGLHAPRKADKGLHTIFRIEAEGIRLAHLGAIDRMLTDAEFEFLQNIDVLLIPVGGGSVLGASDARALVERLEPRVVVPISHLVSGAGDDRYTPVETFLTEMGNATHETVTKYKFQRKDLPEEDLRIVVLERS